MTTLKFGPQHLGSAAGTLRPGLALALTQFVGSKKHQDAEDHALDMEAPARKDMRLWPAADVPRKHRYRPMVVCFMGRRGKGKTLSMTGVGWAQHQRFARYAPYAKIMANYWLSFAPEDLCHPLILDELTGFPPWGQNGMLLADEGDAAFTSRRAMARTTLDFSIFVHQIRKRRMEVCYTTQFPQEIDGQLLRQTDIFIQCEAHSGDRAVDLFIHDYWGQWSGNDWRKPFPPTREECDWQRTLLNTHTLFNKFWSNEVVPPIWHPARQAIIAQQGWAISEDEPEDGEQLQELEHQAEPRSFEEAVAAIASQTMPFSVGRLMGAARKFHGWSSYRRVVEWLQERGFEIGEGTQGMPLVTAWPQDR